MLSLETLFTEARTFNSFEDREVPTEIIHELYDLVKMGPTAVNSCPARFVFITSPEAKARLIPCMDEGNRDKTMKAPLNVIVAYDLAFPETLKELFPHAPEASSWFQDYEVVKAVAKRNMALQAGYLVMAARALGLDVGPMSGFNSDKVDDEFFETNPGQWRWCSDLVLNLGYGTQEGLHPRGPRLSFEQAAQII